MQWSVLRLVHTADADKTKLSRRRCEHNCRQNKTVFFIRVGGVNKLLVADWKLRRDETKLIETGSRQDNLRQDSFVSSAV